MTIKFDGSSGRRPSAEARRYVYVVLALIIQNELSDREGWIFGGIETETDRRRLVTASRAVIKELIRKQKK